MTFSRAGMAIAAVALVGVLAACGDDSTASAPASSVTTTSMSAPASTGSSVSASASPSGSPVTTSPGLPATEPDASQAPAGYPGASGNRLPVRAQSYLDALRAAKVSFVNDTDNSIALGAAEVVCSQSAAKVPGAQITANLLPIVGSGKTNEAAAKADTDKVVAAAKKYYCA